ncbi:uncharacterized protein LOC107226462 [Neodiprion lecontei]|uniref:Uncharacterized protein LOC107226462 n=1 Tax=Neodiprion lecontei TaxID=441921 RepID=A0ABM3FQU4_NEOLC|nr:uncharacterized protein LOC107226462 [Neodiprion lecontei]
MEIQWNKKNLERPAMNIWITSRNSIDLSKFMSALDAAIKDLNSQDLLHIEAAVLSRLIYRMKSKFRNDKGMKNMEKVNRALLNYLEINLLKEFTDIRNCVEIDSLAINLPTKQMVEYLLVRTQGFAKLMCRVESVARSAARFFNARITIGHAWTISVVAYAVISRVWFLSRYLLKRCCSWYNNIYEHINQFEEIGPAWLPENSELPENLKNWLDLPWLDQVTDSVPLKDDGKETIFGLIKAQIDDPNDSKLEDQDFESSSMLIKASDDILTIDNEIPKHENKVSAVKYTIPPTADDIGLSIDRETFEQNRSTEVGNVGKKVKKKSKLKRKIENVSSPERNSQNCESTSVKSKSKKLELTEMTVDISAPISKKQKRKIRKSQAKKLFELSSKSVNKMKRREERAKLKNLQKKLKKQTKSDNSNRIKKTILIEKSSRRKENLITKVE